MLVSEKDFPRLSAMVESIFTAIENCRIKLEDNDPDWDTVDDFLSSLSADIMTAADVSSHLPISTNTESLYIRSIQTALRCYDTFLRSACIERMNESWSKSLKLLVQADYLLQRQRPSTMQSVMGAMDPGAYDA